MAWVPRWFFAFLWVTMVSACGGGGATTSSSSSVTVPVSGLSADVTSPALHITPPTYVATSSRVVLSGAATDSVGVTSVTWSNDRGGSGAAIRSGSVQATNWLTGSIVLQRGDNVLTVIVRDAANNATIQTQTITYAPTAPAPVGRLLRVSPAGSTNSDCIAIPCSTISRAESLALPGDTIEVATGTYGELQVRHWGNSDGWITLKAAAAAEVVIRGAGQGPSIYFYDSGCDEYADPGNVCPPAYWRIEGITVRGSAAGQGDGNAIKLDLSYVTITKSKLCCAYADIVKAVRTASNITLHKNEFWQDKDITPISTNAQGVDKTGGSDLRITQNYFHDIPDVAAYAKGNACRPLIDGNLFFNTGTTRGGSTVMLGQQTDAHRLVKGCGATTSPYYESYDGVASNNLVINAVRGCVAVSSSHNARVLNNTCINVGTAGSAAFYMTNESAADPHPGYPNGRQPSDSVEFRGNHVQNVQGRMFSDSDALAIDNWSNFVVADNVWYATQPLVFFLKNSLHIYNGGTYAQWLLDYTAMTGRTDNSSIANPNLDATALMNAWLVNFNQ